MQVVRLIDPYLGAALVLGVLWLGFRIGTGSWRFWKIAVGVDGRYSSSRFQGLVWSIVVLFSYVAMFVARAHAGSVEPIRAIPPNVLVALGLSLGTTAAAAGITSSRVSRQVEVKSQPGAEARGFAALVEDDNGRPDLAKAQLLAWAFVTLAVYVVATTDAVSRTLATTDLSLIPGLPDIDTTLLVLSGIGQGSYLANKAAATPTGPNSASPAATALATAVQPAPGHAAMAAVMAPSLRPGSARVVGFTPSVNGFQFTNSFPPEPTMTIDLPVVGRVPIGDASNGVCGGMVCAARDIFETPGMAPISNPTQPGPNDPLFRYIVKRLIASFELPRVGFLKYYEWMLTPDGDTGWPPFVVRRGLAWKTIVEEWPNRIRPELDAGRLCCLGLVTTASPNPADLGHNHQVMAYGYDLDAEQTLTLLISDPNTSPANADRVRISVSLANPEQVTQITHNVGIDHPIRGFFMVDYTYEDPTGQLA